MKKIISLLAMLLILASFTWVNALMVEPTTKDLVLTRENLKSIKNGEKYMWQIDTFISKYGKHKQILEILSLRITNAKWIIAGSWKILSERERNMLIILAYLDVTVWLALYNLNAE